MNKLITKLLEENIEQLSHKAKSYYHDYQYYLAPRIKEALIITLKQRSEYKRALKEYKKLCNYVTIEKYYKAVEIYRKYPEKYIEQICGIKLMPYQKIVLKMMWNRRGNV